MKILICGSRTWQHYKMIENCLRRFKGEYPNLFIIEGEADGADKMAKKACKHLNIPYKGYPAVWYDEEGKFRRNGGFLRNIQMLNDGPGLVVAFKRGKSPGTSHTIKEARKRGIPTRVFTDRG